MGPTRVLSRIVVGAAALVVLAGCPPTYPKCNSDEHCKEHNEVCVQGQCQECATDDQCKAGFVCDANKCVPKPECQSDGECGSGKKCRAGKCAAEAAVKPEGSCVTNEDCPGSEECKEGRCAPKSSATVSCSYEPIFFDFNEYKLTGDATGKLSALADCIKKESARVTVEGHADDRGTEEYNLQLSNKRAASVKRYLTDLGVSGGTLDTVGFGENRPAQGGQSESAWAANRRVEFKKR